MPDCDHTRDDRGVCTKCGDCIHDVVLNGQCLYCGKTEFEPPTKKQQVLIPLDKLIKR